MDVGDWLRSLGLGQYEATFRDNVAVLFGDAVRPTHAARSVGCWAPKQDNLAIEQTSGRQRINIHSAIDLQTGQTRMIEAETTDAMSTIRLLESI